MDAISRRIGRDKIVLVLRQQMKLRIDFIEHPMSPHSVDSPCPLQGRGVVADKGQGLFKFGVFLGLAAKVFQKGANCRVRRTMVVVSGERRLSFS